jgi:hypothetical protein
MSKFVTRAGSFQAPSKVLGAWSLLASPIAPYAALGLGLPRMGIVNTAVGEMNHGCHRLKACRVGQSAGLGTRWPDHTRHSRNPKTRPLATQATITFSSKAS